MDDDEHTRRRWRTIAVENLRDSDTIVLLDRSDDPEPWVALRAIRALRDHLEVAEQRAVGAARAEGGSWRRIGDALGCSHQRASSKHRDDRSTAIGRHPSSPEGSVDVRMHLLDGGLDPAGVVLPDGRWVAHDDLTVGERSLLREHRTPLSSVAPPDRDEPGP